MKVLVTGATGFLGRRLVPTLVQEGHEVSILTHAKTDLFHRHNIETTYEVDLRSPFCINETFDFIFHLAAYNVTHVGDANSPDYYGVNVEGTKRVLDSINYGNFVYFSTAKLYKSTDGVIDEQTKLDTSNYYEESKLQGELICFNRCTTNSLYIFRSVNIAGQGQQMKALIPICWTRAT